MTSVFFRRNWNTWPGQEVRQCGWVLLPRAINRKCVKTWRHRFLSNYPYTINRKCKVPLTIWMCLLSIFFFEFWIETGNGWNEIPIVSKLFVLWLMGFHWCRQETFFAFHLKMHSVTIWISIFFWVFFFFFLKNIWELFGNKIELFFSFCLRGLMFVQGVFMW